MEVRPQPTGDLRSSIRYNTKHIPIMLTSNDLCFDIPARLSNVSAGGIQIVCSNYSAQQLSKPKYSLDSPLNIVAEILDKDDSKTFELSCKVVYIHQNHSPNEYCSDSVGMEALMDNPENRRVLSHFIERNT